jgi:hypothetical protein
MLSACKLITYLTQLQILIHFRSRLHDERFLRQRSVLQSRHWKLVRDSLHWFRNVRCYYQSAARLNGRCQFAALGLESVAATTTTTAAATKACGGTQTGLYDRHMRRRHDIEELRVQTVSRVNGGGAVVALPTGKMTRMIAKRPK